MDFNYEAETVETPRDYRWILWVVAGIILCVDQWSKARIIGWLALGESWRPLAGTPVLEWFAFTHTMNTGAAFGMLPSFGWFFVAIAVIVSLAIVWYYPRLPRDRWWLFLALGLQLGGALGNLTDRLRIGWVTDFIHIGNFFIFNVADSALFCGTILLAYYLYREDEKQEAAAREIAHAYFPAEGEAEHAAPVVTLDGETWRSVAEMEEEGATTPREVEASPEGESILWGTNGLEETELGEASSPIPTTDDEENVVPARPALDGNSDA